MSCKKTIFLGAMIALCLSTTLKAEVKDTSQYTNRMACMDEQNYLNLLNQKIKNWCSVAFASYGLDNLVDCAAVVQETFSALKFAQEYRCLNADSRPEAYHCVRHVDAINEPFEAVVCNYAVNKDVCERYVREYRGTPVTLWTGYFEGRECLPKPLPLR